MNLAECLLDGMKNVSFPGSWKTGTGFSQPRVHTVMVGRVPAGHTANVYSQITFTLLWKLARNTKGICKCQVRQYMSKKYADLEQKLLKSKSSLLVLQVILRNHGT